MKSYFGPILALWIAIALVLGPGAIGLSSALTFAAGVILYLVGSFWWVAVAIAPERRAWPDALLVWTIAIPPAVWAETWIKGAADMDKTSMGVIVGGVPALALATVCSCVTVILLRRRRLAA